MSAVGLQVPRVRGYAKWSAITVAAASEMKNWAQDCNMMPFLWDAFPHAMVADWMISEEG